jgi:glutaredoxin 2
MDLILYHYVHCPFCIRVRMTLGHLKLPYKSVVLPYDDEQTPLKLTGTKMLPIIQINGKAMNESLDIMAALDTQNLLNLRENLEKPDFLALSGLLTKLGANVHNLAMPYWIYTPEFNEVSRNYFQKKKEQKRGPFKNLVHNQSIFAKEIAIDLKEVAQDLKPFYRSDSFGPYDILLASHIWGLYVVPEFHFEERIHNYLMKVKEVTNFNYHQDFWK